MFASHLRWSCAYRNPCNYWWAAIRQARALGFECDLDRKWADGVAVALEKGLPEYEQAAPLTVPVLRRLAAAVATDTDFTLVLSRVAALFCVARADCCLHIRPSDIVDLGPDRVQMSLHRLKGERRQQSLHMA